MSPLEAFLGDFPVLSIFNPTQSVQGRAKKFLLSSVRAGGLCIGCPKLVDSMNAGN